MGRWTDLAQWRGSTINSGDGDGKPGEAADRLAEHRGVIVHIAQGTYEGTISWQRNPSADVSSHFVVAKDGRIAQVVDTAERAWTQRDGNSSWLSIENEGFVADGGLTAAQVTANAKILARAHREHGIPLQLATSPTGRGLGHHSMGAESGYNWGHSECPGTKIKAQKPEILRQAKAIVSGATETEEEPDMTPAQDGSLSIAWEDAEAWTLGLDTTPERKRPHWGTREAKKQTALLLEVKANLAQLAGRDWVDETAIVAAVVQGFGPQLINAVRSELGDIDDDRVVDAVERGLRTVLGGLDGATPTGG
ncbi:peptidoglycan recognition family protein [Micromonospora sp. NPDC048986]|uniref:peptidoglycan recognition protein family protein n=1 Tax=Micromonospora sp. NPDC048986 TaxID=3155644 RepID=UPI003411587B